VKLSNVKYRVFKCETEHYDAKFNLDFKNTLLVKNENTKVSSLNNKLELVSTKMVKTLKLPRECLVIAWIYICRAVSKMQSK
jgi:hypothetical protein